MAPVVVAAAAAADQLLSKSQRVIGVRAAESLLGVRGFSSWNQWRRQQRRQRLDNRTWAAVTAGSARVPLVAPVVVAAAAAAEQLLSLWSQNC